MITPIIYYCCQDKKSKFLKPYKAKLKFFYNLVALHSQTNLIKFIKFMKIKKLLKFNSYRI